MNLNINTSKGETIGDEYFNEPNTFAEYSNELNDV